LGYNSRLNPDQVKFQIPVTATNASSQGVACVAAFPGEVMGATVVAISAIVSGTTTGSSGSFILYKNASSAGSIIATFNGSGTQIAANGSQALQTSGTAGTTNGRFAAGDALVAEYIGGVGQTGVVTGAAICVDVAYGRQTGATPSAGTGPA
jgi:hypothetical protein